MRHSASILFLAPIIAQAVACAPYDAEIKGSWHVWLAANSSNTVETDAIEELDNKATHYECVRTWDISKERWADGYIGPREEDGMEWLGHNTIAAINAGEQSDPRKTGWQDSKFVGGPCQAEQIEGADTVADPSDDVFALLPSHAFPVDDPDTTEIDESFVADEDLVDYPLEAICTQDMMRKYVEDCEPLQDASGGSYFLDEDGYYAMKGGIEPWRTEAILTGEGELQLAFHQEIQGEDWHLIWTIDPDFKPEACVSTEDGEAEVVPVHGSSWLEEWSIEEDGYTIYYVNAGAFHTPDRGETLWYYPSDWTSGFSYAKFIGEEFINVQPRVRNSIESIDEELAYEDLDENGVPDEQEDFIAEESFSTALDQTEWIENAGASYDGWNYQVKLEDNLWRPLDTVPGGLDGWTERNYSWVRIKDGSNIKEGGSVKGDFQITLSGIESNSRMVIQGEFTVDELKVDKWAYPVLEEELRESEQGEKFCK